jgi:hypothetical protein
MLANSVDTVERRLSERGKHVAPFTREADAGKIAHSFRNAIYADEQEELFFGIPLLEFTQLISDAGLVLQRYE